MTFYRGTPLGDAYYEGYQTALRGGTPDDKRSVWLFEAADAWHTGYQDGLAAKEG